jgi:hypothetical protein
MTVQTVDVRLNGDFVGVIVVIRVLLHDRRCRRQLLHADFFPGSGLREQVFVRHWRPHPVEREPVACRKAVSAPRHPVVGAIGLPQYRPTRPHGHVVWYSICVDHCRYYELSKDNAYAHD